MRGKILFIFLGLTLVLSFVSANFETGYPNHAIEKQYISYGNIKGWINMSFDDEPGDSLFEDSFRNSLSLLDLLKTNLGISYTCSTGSLCLSNYEVIGSSESTKSFSLNSGEKKIIGFKITGDSVNVNSVTFNVESDATASCNNQLKIDFLRDGNVDFSNNKISTFYCSSKNYGCFDELKPLFEAEITSESYCQKITLSESPEFNVGAWIKEKTAGNKKLFMKIYDMDENYVASCELPAASSIGGEINCDLNYHNTKAEEYYVCVSPIGSGGEYYIRGYSDLSGGCGYKGSPTIKEPKNSAYQIFVIGKKFSAIETLEVPNILPKGKTLSERVDDYIEIRYSGDCSSGCIIPIEFISKVNQNLVLKDLNVNYAFGEFTGVTEEFYDLNEISPIINSEFQIIYLDEGNFSVPSDYGEHAFEFDLDNEEIFSQMIIVKSSPLIKGLKPKITAAAVPTRFEVLIDSLNITKYEWGFGDGTNIATTVNKVTHIYNSTGVYDLKIIITDYNQLTSSKTFKINVSSPEQAINTTLKKKLDDLSRIGLQMKQFKFEQNLKSVLNFDSLESQLNKIEQDYKKASSENDYKKIIISLLGVEVPESIDAVKNAESITFHPKKNNINLDVIKEIGGGNYDTQDSDGYADALIFWNQENMDTKVTFSEFSASYGYFEEEPILRTFEFQINKKNILDHSYLIIAKLDGIEFGEDYFMKEEAGYLYMELEQDSETIRFTTTEDVNFVDVPVFISPKLKKLKITESFEIGEEENGSKWIFFSFVLFFLVLFGVGLYIILQEWYKKRYETYLFKRKNDLYNLMIYITEEKKKGLTNKKVYSKLRKSGWSSEQVNYVLRKHSGKRTGMFEIISLGKKKIQQKQSSVTKNKDVFNKKSGKLKVS